MGKTDERARKMYDGISKCLDNLEGAEKELTANMLYSYCWFAAQMDELTDKIDREGAIIEVEKGGANNKHIVNAENPAIGTLHKISARKAEYYTKLLRVIPDEMSEVDDFEEFLRS